MKVLVPPALVVAILVYGWEFTAYLLSTRDRKHWDHSGTSVVKSLGVFFAKVLCALAAAVVIHSSLSEVIFLALAITAVFFAFNDVIDTRFTTRIIHTWPTALILAGISLIQLITVLWLGLSG